ncbi:hypothetical protein [Nocardioides panaciterrulae]|uniref:Glycosyl hydrolase family 98 putative carbohydrate-binding module domain-containing protein n=1 Tax=Nocardioides panaciterrulae TaxID=661492 RepID=A0A7Y9J8Z3_9ACTN|nr:hypothetical protein [Nocardioides panaciterrulae]NYD40057.1 hypothetical protein [Nocardioides panaciterrulae]
MATFGNRVANTRTRKYVVSGGVEVRALKRVRIGLVAGLLVGLVAPLSAMTDTAEARTAGLSAESRVAAKSIAKPVLTSSAKAVKEGDRLTLTVTVKSPRTATSATFQKWYVPVYGTASWQTVKTVKVNGRRKVRFKRVATDENTERYRVFVTYRHVARPVVSNAVSVTIWRWIPLSDYHPYYTTGGTTFGTTTINGVAYTGWGVDIYSHTGSWESRFTPGRHCRSFKAVLGVADISADGSSGAITFTADDTQVYASPTLTPGMSVPVTVDLAKPYRFGIQLLDTTPGATTERDAVESWPVLGEPTFLCTGV